MSGTPTLDWQAQALETRLAPLLPGLSVEVLAESESTNTLLIEQARQAGTDARPTLLVSEHQRGGRGRMGRAWVAAPGASLTFSLGLVLPPAADTSGLSLAVGCALAEALEPSGRQLRIKWPNDLWLVDADAEATQGRKLGGILIESQLRGAQRYLVVGVGLNVRALEAGADASQLGSGYASTSELQAGLDQAPAVLDRVAPALLRCVLDFEGQGFAAWQTRFEQRDLCKGHPVTAGELVGVAQGVSDSGELLLQTPSGPQRIASGEVSLRLDH